MALALATAARQVAAPPVARKPAGANQRRLSYRGQERGRRYRRYRATSNGGVQCQLPGLTHLTGMNAKITHHDITSGI